MLSWDHVQERMAEARNYWVATVRPDGRPHATPVWGLWVDGAFYFGVAPGTRRRAISRRTPTWRSIWRVATTW